MHSVTSCVSLDVYGACRASQVWPLIHAASLPSISLQKTRYHSESQTLAMKSDGPGFQIAYVMDDGQVAVTEAHSGATIENGARGPFEVSCCVIREVFGTGLMNVLNSTVHSWREQWRGGQAYVQQR
jgi:hypothetical protein